MRILCSAPRYDRVTPWCEDAQVAFLVAASQAGHEVLRTSGESMAGLFIDRARTFACEEALRLDCDALLMVDADCDLSGPDAVRLCEEAVRHEWALLAAPIACRNGARAALEYIPNWQPADEDRDPTPEEARALLRLLRLGRPAVMAGFVGTGVSAVTTAALRRIPAPWWTRPEKAGENERRRSPGVDVAFSRRALAAGERIGVHFGIRSGGHYGMIRWESEGLLRSVEGGLAAIAGEVGA